MSYAYLAIPVLLSMEPVFEQVCHDSPDTCAAYVETANGCERDEDEQCLQAPLPIFVNEDAAILKDTSKVFLSEITVSGVGAQAPEELRINIDISHTSRGDLEIVLVSPEGSRYRLKSRNEIDRFDDINGWWVVDASRDMADGIWRLEIKDHFYGNAGVLNEWSLEF